MNIPERTIDELLDTLLERVHVSYEYLRIDFLTLLCERDEKIRELKQRALAAKERVENSLHGTEEERKALTDFSSARELFYSHPRMKEIIHLSQRLERRLAPLYDTLKNPLGKRYALLFDTGGER